MLPAAEERVSVLASAEKVFSLAAGVDLAALETHQGAREAQGKKLHQGIFSKKRTIASGATWAKWSGTHQDRSGSWSKTVLGSALDANGNTLSDPSGKAYTWDFENRLTQAVVPGTNGGTTTFKYDPFGRRIQKSGPLGTTNYLYDGQDISSNVIEELDSVGNVLARYAQGPGIDRPLAEFNSGAASYYEADALGSVTSLSNSAGAAVNTYSYDSFGNLITFAGVITNHLQYTGREFDPETGLNFYRARYYSNSAGRFVSEDPIGFEGGNDFYAYVRNNPVLWIDPLGLVSCTYDVTGHHFHCTSDDGSQSFDTTHVRSGNGSCMNNPECNSTRNKGPIPPGRYSMGGMGDTPNPHRIPRVYLTPMKGTFTFGRDSFEVHQGGDNSSAGCITLDPGAYTIFRQFYSIDNHGVTTVQ
jgi:RHS repeat-associated protein